MKRTILAIGLCAALSACSATGVQSASAQTVTAADALYIAASIAGEEGVKLGQIDKATFQARDQQAYQMLLLVRAGKATVDQLSAITNTLTGN